MSPDGLVVIAGHEDDGRQHPGRRELRPKFDARDITQIEVQHKTAEVCVTRVLTQLLARSKEVRFQTVCREKATDSPEHAGVVVDNGDSRLLYRHVGAPSWLS